jgi:hypothetical protein
VSAEFLVGATAMGCLAIAVFFLRFWRLTGDRFHALFALAFAIFGVNRIVLGFLDEDSEARPIVYLARLLAFLVIAVAIVDKNRARVTPGSAPDR